MVTSNSTNTASQSHEIAALRLALEVMAQALHEGDFGIPLFGETPAGRKEQVAKALAPLRSLSPQIDASCALLLYESEPPESERLRVARMHLAVADLAKEGTR